MARNFKELTKDFTPERKARIAERTAATLEKMSLHELRKHLRHSQAEVAEQMQVGQGTISKIEQRGDTSMRTLDRYVRALGGRLEIRAHLNGKTVELALQAEE